MGLIGKLPVDRYVAKHVAQNITSVAAFALKHMTRFIGKALILRGALPKNLEQQ